MTAAKFEIHEGDCLSVLATLPANRFNTCITSPPYWNQRDYGVAGQLGLERAIGDYVTRLVNIFREVRRTLREDGTLWLNLGDTYCRGESRYQGLKKGDLVGVPWRVALALQADGWYLRSDVVWSKSNGLPESTKDRPTHSHEYIFLLARNRDYYCDMAAIREPVSPNTLKRHKVRIHENAPTGKNLPQRDKHISRMNPAYRDLPPDVIAARGRNKRSVWTCSCSNYKGAHFATFPEALITPCVLAGCPPGGTVLDCFSGAGTTGAAALRHGRNFTGIELNPQYLNMARKRLEGIGI